MALGVIGECVLYPPLRNALWNEVDAAIEASLGLEPIRKGKSSRVFQLADLRVRPFLVIEFQDFAGGRFSFLGALGSSATPNGRTPYSAKLRCPGQGEVCLVGGEELEGSCGPVAVDPDWQTPPKELIRDALKLESAQAVLMGLGVTESQRHHLLSFEILDALGIQVSEHHFAPVVDKFRPKLDPVLLGPVAQLIELLIRQARSCAISCK